jgi:2-C-methyl-D-erythritol 4-phosphate cytidylyltransferase
MAVALVVAAGRGERLGYDRPKALVEVAGVSMLDWCLAALRQVQAVERIVVALPAEALSAAPEDVLAVPGGLVRSESVRAALAAAGPGDPVIVHDAARPLASPALFLAGLDALGRSGADGVVAAAPVTDTIKQVSEDGRSVEQTLDRRRLWAVQTPQVFRREVLDRVLLDATAEQLARATDDAWLVEASGGCVEVFPAPPDNLKITTGLDLRLAEILLGEGAR